MKPLKILFTIPNFDTAGSGKALLNIALGLDPNIFEPHIMCMHDRGAFFSVVKESGIPIHIYPYTTQMKPYFYGIMKCFKISREFKRIAPDLIHSFHYNADYSEALAAKIAGIEWIFTKKNMKWGGSSANGWKLRTWLASSIAVQNTDMLIKFFPKTKKAYFIPRGVNINEFTFDYRLPDLRSKYGIPKDEKIIITVANLVPIKGVEVLIKAYYLVNKFIDKWTLVIVGDDRNEYANKLKELSIKLNLNHKIIFTGKVTDVKTHLQMAQIFVLPTLDQGEGSPVSLLEAMANNRCVLGSDVPGIKDLLKMFPDNLFKAGDVSDLKLKLSDLMFKSSESREELGKKFSKHTQSFYSIQKEVDLHQRMYLNLF